MVSAPNDHDAAIDRITGYLLRAGVLLSALVLTLGGVVYLSRHGLEENPDRHKFTPLPEKYSRPAEMLRAICAGEARPLIQLGVVLLIATPLIRVLFTAIAFAWKRDPVYVILPLIVLAVLTVGVWAGQLE